MSFESDAVPDCATSAISLRLPGFEPGSQALSDRIISLPWEARILTAGLQPHGPENNLWVLIVDGIYDVQKIAL